MKIKNTKSHIKVLILITGSIAAVKIPLLVSKLIKENFEIKCVLSKNAEKLIQPISLSILSRNPCILENDQWLNYQSSPQHIALCNWADIVIVAPLTATTLSKWVMGNADGLIPSILIANDKPTIVAPAMNTKMWLNQAVQRNYNHLNKYENVLCLQPSEGILACDEIGIGKIPPNDLIQLALEFILSQKQKPFCKDLLNKDVLAKNNKGKSTIKRLFNKIKKNPKKFIAKDQLVKNKYRAISDFISGMTDRYAINLNNNYK